MTPAAPIARQRIALLIAALSALCCRISVEVSLVSWTLQGSCRKARRNYRRRSRQVALWAHSRRRPAGSSGVAPTASAALPDSGTFQENDRFTPRQRNFPSKLGGSEILSHAAHNGHVCGAPFAPCPLIPSRSDDERHGLLELGSVGPICFLCFGDGFFCNCGSQRDRREMAENRDRPAAGPFGLRCRCGALEFGRAPGPSSVLARNEQ